MILYYNKSTFVIITAVATVLLQQNAAVRSIPSVVTSAFPLGISVHSALTMARARVRTTFHGAVLSIPTSDAKTSTIFALTVFVTARIALFHVAQFAGPTRHAIAGVVNAMTMRSTVEVTEFWNRRNQLNIYSSVKIYDC